MNDEIRDYLKEKELAQKLNVDRLTLKKWRRKGMPYLPVGTRQIRYDLSSVVKWLDSTFGASK